MSKLYHAFTGEPGDKALNGRMKSSDTAELLSGILVTSQELVFRHYLKRLYLPFCEILWAYRQVEESHVSLGCCGGVLEEFRVVLRGAGGKQAVLTFDRDADAVRLLDFLCERISGCAIGWTKENRERFGVPERS